MAQKILVAGGAGFIGSSIVDLLLGNGYKVRIVDDFSSGKKDNIKQYADSDDFEIVEGTILNKAIVEKSVEGVDAIVDMVGKGDLARSVENPVLYHETNLTGTVNLLAAASKRGIKKFVFASSGSIYTSKAVGVIKEDAEYGPESPYAATKVCSEIYCRTFNTVYGMEAVALRFFNVYGPRRENSTYGGAVTNFMLNIMKGKQVTIYGTGEDKRDYVYVKDVANAVMLALKPGISGEFNVGTGEGTSTNRLLEQIEASIGKKADVARAPARKGDSPSRIADITKISEALDYEPNYTLEDGINELRDYLQAKFKT